MANKNLHDKPFDETTITKLRIFEDYAQAWIPTFVMKGYPEICIFDFFAGTGYDINKVEGSPIRILMKIREHIKHVFQKRVKINLFFNEFEPETKTQKKFELLKEACESYLSNHEEVRRAGVNIVYSNEDFATIFPKYLSKIKSTPSLVYLDQNGIKYLAFKYLLELEKTKQTDFIYFLSASYFWRFGDRKEFRDHINLDLEMAKKDPYNFVHRSILEQLRTKLPEDTQLKLYPFSLKKGSNIYGIVFGASHVRAVDKFLSVAWKKNGMNGQANFDMYNDAKKAQLTLDFFGEKRLTKIEDFQQRLENAVRNGEISSNLEALHFTYNEGHIPSHAKERLIELKRQGVVNYDGLSPLITYEQVYKNKCIIPYKLNKK